MHALSQTINFSIFSISANLRELAADSTVASICPVQTRVFTLRKKQVKTAQFPKHQLISLKFYVLEASEC